MEPRFWGAIPTMGWVATRHAPSASAPAGARVTWGVHVARHALVLAVLLIHTAAGAEAFDHQHARWSALLAKHVVVSADGTSSTVRYVGFRQDRAALAAVLDELSAVPQMQFSSWSRAQQLAFLINAYNAFTVALIADAAPGLRSIKDLGSLFRTPWARPFFVLLDARRSLDDVEHRLIRAPGRYDEPRIHFAVVCASIGCPMLRPEAYVAEWLAPQLADATRRFLTDRTRNRFDAGRGRLEVSRLFDWYGQDFSAGGGLAAFIAEQAGVLADTPADAARLRAGDYELAFTDYDWRLNAPAGETVP